MLLSFASVATAYHIIAFRQLRLHANIEWAKGFLQQQNERLRMNAIERELTVARQVKQVNSTLIMLAHSAPHTATLGVLIVDATSASYYFCGHLPVFFANGFSRDHQGTSDDHVVFDSMPGRGNLVGIFKELDLKPVKFSFSETPVESLLLGTDGIFNQGSRIKRRKIQDLLCDLDQRGDQALDRANVDDDQLLIWVQRKTAVNKAA